MKGRFAMISIRAAAMAFMMVAGLAGHALAADGAGPVLLKPADPQPAGLSAGLAVQYAYPGDMRYLHDAESARGRAEDGPPLIGFDYPDSFQGAKVMTSTRTVRVAAFIEGYIRFDTPGIWRMQFHSNDGLSVSIGGREVYRHDGRHACNTEGWKNEFEVPSAGWYPVKATYFQRLGTSCMMMQWQPPGRNMTWTPTDVYGFKP
ncbi:MAG: hypothetical protein ACJAVR_001043 [Paracoccaceae bacterium]|jgi:hypothetical protein